MKGYDIINLDEELQELFKKEEMLAMFQFELSTNSSESFTGLCRVSKAREGEKNSRYFSLIFIVDSPDMNRAHDIKTSLNNLGFDRLIRSVPEITREMSFMNPQSTARHCFYEAYLYFDSPTVSPEKLLAEKIYPALKVMPELRVGELTFWEEIKK